MEFDRTIVGIDYETQTITVDTPLAQAIDSRWGGGIVYKYDNIRINNVGIENIELISAYDPNVQCTLRYRPFVF